ncbi:MAG: hypothetical protein AAB229_07345 [Candidatus Hydrogenedentota bacterium]
MTDSPGSKDTAEDRVEFVIMKTREFLAPYMDVENFSCELAAFETRFRRRTAKARVDDSKRLIESQTVLLAYAACAAAEIRLRAAHRVVKQAREDEELADAFHTLAVKRVIQEIQRGGDPASLAEWRLDFGSCVLLPIRERSHWQRKTAEFVVEMLDMSPDELGIIASAVETPDKAPANIQQIEDELNSGMIAFFADLAEWLIAAQDQDRQTLKRVLSDSGFAKTVSAAAAGPKPLNFIAGLIVEIGAVAIDAPAALGKDDDRQQQLVVARYVH